MRVKQQSGLLRKAERHEDLVSVPSLSGNLVPNDLFLIYQLDFTVVSVIVIQALKKYFVLEQIFCSDSVLNMNFIPEQIFCSDCGRDKPPPF